MTTSDEGLGARPGPNSGRSKPQLVRLLRRVHLYLGLLLCPFVLLFGITGLSFNHPTIGRGLAVDSVSAHDVARATGFHPWDAAQVASEVVASLNTSGAGYRLVEPGAARFSGWPLFAAPASQGKQVVIVSLSDGSATITERPEPPAATPAPFADAEVRLPARDLKQLAQQLTPLLAERGVAVLGPLAPHPKVHPELAFRLLDRNGRAWNALYDFGTGKLAGKPSAEPRRGALIELLEAIHTQHHYPPHPSATRWWALFADLTAATLIVWAVTGLTMWWQMRRLRKLGAVVLLAALGLAAAVIGSTAAELSFTPAAEE